MVPQPRSNSSLHLHVTNTTQPIPAPAVREKKPEANEGSLDDPYFDIKIHENEEDQDNIVCDVCLEGDDAEGDEIVICELCLAATHQSCYKGEIERQLPAADQPWYCARCTVLVNDKSKKANEIQCFFCPDLKGIMKPIEGSVAKWAHIICVNWIPEIWFNDD